MILPKPTMLVMPTYGSPNGVGIGACNSNNKCDNQACDNGHVEGSSVWEVIKDAGSTAIRMATMMWAFA